MAEKAAVSTLKENPFKSGAPVWKDMNRLLYGESTGTIGTKDGKDVLYVQNIHSVANNKNLGSNAWLLSRIVQMNPEEAKLYKL